MASASSAQEFDGESMIEDGEPNGNLNKAEWNETKSEQEEWSVGAGGDTAMRKEDSGIMIDGLLSMQADEAESSPWNTSMKEGASDVDVNDSESFQDSALPLSAESGGETKSSEDSPLCKERHGREKGDSTSNSDDLLNLDCEIDMKSPAKSKSSSPGISPCRSGAGGSPGSKRMSSDDEESPKSKRRVQTTVDSVDESESAVEQNGLDAAVGDESLPVEGASDRLSAQSSDDGDDDEDDDDDDDDDDTNEYDPLTRIRMRRRKRCLIQRAENHTMKMSSDETDTTEDNEDSEHKDSDDEKRNELDEGAKKATMAILNKPLPKPNWFAVAELKEREYGYSSRQSTCYFRERVQGSLQMVRRLTLVDSMKYHEGCVNALSFNRIGTLLASGSDDLNIVLWNWQRCRPSLIYDSGHRSNVFQAKFMPYSGDCHVISCARDGQVRLAELSLTGVCKTTRKLAQHRGAAHKLALEMDSPNVFLSCGEDALTYLFDLREERPHKLVTTKENEKKVPLYSIHSNPADPKEFCVGGRDHYIRVYDKRKIAEEVDGGVLKKLCPDHLVNSEVKANVTCACYNYNGTEILGSYNDEDIYLFDNTFSDGANFIHRYTGHRNNATVKGVNYYGPKSEFIVSGSDCGNVYFWDKETEAIVNFQEGDDAGVINVLEPHPSLPVLATSGLDHDVKLWMPGHEDMDLDWELLKKTVKKNHMERTVERTSEPEMIGGQMLWFIMHHFRNSARRRMREEGQVLSSSEEDNDSHSDDPDTSEMQCTQS